jgi:hypothetical protein
MSDRRGIMAAMTADTDTTEITKTCEIFNRRPGPDASPGRHRLLDAETAEDRILGDDWVIRGVVHRTDSGGRKVFLRDEIVASGFLSAAEAAAWAAENGYREFTQSDLEEAAETLRQLTGDEWADMAVIARLRRDAYDAGLGWMKKFAEEAGKNEKVLKHLAGALGRHAPAALAPNVADMFRGHLVEVKDILSFHCPEAGPELDLSDQLGPHARSAYEAVCAELDRRAA